MAIARDELRKIPYLNVEAIGPRVVNLMPLWDGTRWHTWLDTPQGLFEMHPVDAYKSDYVARSAASPSDVIIPFVELMWQRASWPETARLVSAISADFHNLGTSIEKIDHFYVTRNEIGMPVADFVATEMEYIFVLSRSVFDLVHSVFATIWGGERITLLDENAEAKRKRHHLPDSFQKMLYKGRRTGEPTARSRQEYVDDFALPLSLADAYMATTNFFDDVRSLRNKIVHGVADAGILFSTDRGFCIPKNFREVLGIRCPVVDAPHNDNIVSLLPLLAYVVVGTIDCCSLLATQFAAQIELLDELAPGYRMFVRGPHNDALLWALSVSKGGSPWWSDRERKAKRSPPEVVVGSSQPIPG